MLSFLITSIIFLLILVTGFYKILYQNRQLTYINDKTDRIYHDVNSSLVAVKLIIESLKEFSLEHIDSIASSKLTSLVTILEEGVGEIEDSFR